MTVVYLCGAFVLTMTRIAAQLFLFSCRVRSGETPGLAGQENKKAPTKVGAALSLVHLRDKISNPLIQTLDALSSLYQLITGKFSF